ncbi:hypothetical protein DPEC_G00247240 [Dallia pectoralis]|uniref:Uncharacterized protein n=1 Tax=Dallia pectoralis TaxID=75939 RepID=A0ACC2FWG6_DALPE|nr:hypothetical protein DPEC_G00247240 [Dallia pectoralis]
MYRRLSDRDSGAHSPASECLGSSMTQDSRDCLGSMTPESQDFYLRMDHHRRRSGYRLGRIIARQQLLKRIAGAQQSGLSPRAMKGIPWRWWLVWGMGGMQFPPPPSRCVREALELDQSMAALTL